MEKIKAEIVADSINPQGDRITTYLLTFPRFILAQLNTHRVFSKNSASSRAIPFEKMVKMVETDPCIPIAWQKPHKGMQGNEYYDHTLTEEVGGIDYTNLPRRWLRARDTAVSMAKIMTDEGMNMPITKQLANRLLEPFMWHTVLLTGTEFENFFNLRCPQYNFPDVNQENIFKSRKEVIRHFKDTMYFEKYWKKEASEIDWLQRNESQAEIHMQALAEAMWDEYNESTPKTLQSGEWHIPFGDKIDEKELDKLMPEIQPASLNWHIEQLNILKIKVATARCARLSYMTFDGEIDYEKDLKLHDTLLESQHMSPFEHCARAMSEVEYNTFFKGEDLHESSSNFNIRNKGWCNNYRGFIQYRYLIENHYDGSKI